MTLFFALCMYFKSVAFFIAVSIFTFFSQSMSPFMDKVFPYVIWNVCICSVRSTAYFKRIIYRQKTPSNKNNKNDLEQNWRTARRVRCNDTQCRKGYFLPKMCQM